MKLSLAVMLFAATCVAGEIYFCERVEIGSVIDDDGVQRDTSSIKNAARFTVVRTNESSVLIKFVHAASEVQSGNNILKYYEPLASLDDQMQKARSDVIKTSVLLSSQGIKVDSGKETIAEGEHWGEIESVLFDKAVNEKIAFAAIVPVVNLIAKTPLLLNVPVDIQPDDIVEIPYVTPIPPSQLLSTGQRPALLKCTKRKGQLLEFNSNFDKTVDDLHVTWDVLLKYDLDRQVTVHVEIERITKMQDSRSKHHHVVRETLRFATGESGKDIGK
jgi:hypothetical protein